MLRLGAAANLETDGYVCVLHPLSIRRALHVCSTQRPMCPKNSRLPADPTILIDTTSLYGAKHPGVTVVPSSGGRKASCDAEKCCEGSAHGASQYLLEYMHTAFYNGCLLGTTC